MGKILQALYEGNLLAEPVTEKRSQEYQKSCDFTFDLLEELSQKLNEEQRSCWISLSMLYPMKSSIVQQIDLFEDIVQVH